MIKERVIGSKMIGLRMSLWQGYAVHGRADLGESKFTLFYTSIPWTSGTKPRGKRGLTNDKCLDEVAQEQYHGVLKADG